jgi:ABC-type multidrug transport system fused ATPase/permease subunit
MSFHSFGGEISNDMIYPTRALIRDLFHFIRPHKARFFASTIIRIIANIATLYQPYAFAFIVSFLTTYQSGISLFPVWTVLGLWLLSLIVRHTFICIAKMMAFNMGNRIVLDAELEMIDHMFQLDTSWHEHENTGNKLKKIIRGAESIDKILRIWIVNFLEILTNFVGIIFVISRFDVSVSVIVVVFILSYYAIARYFTEHASAASRKVNAKEEDIHGLYFEALNNFRTVKILAMGKALLAILHIETKDLFKKVKTRIFWFQTGNTVKVLWGAGFRIGTIISIIYGISQGYYQVGFLVLFYTYFNEIWQSISELSDIGQDFVIAKHSVARMMEVLEQPITIDKEEGKVLFPQTWQKISLRNVSFSYNDNQVLQNISFDITRGERIGIVGLSGAGKSTLFKLLLKEHENYEGDILVDDVPLRTVSKLDYFKNTAAVLQDTEVFNFTLRENIILANSEQEKNTELFDRSLKVSHTFDFLNKLPKGVETEIGEKGVRLSGGERQRLGLARAVFKNPQILLLDEATSHLDIESEEKIRASLHEFFQSVTAVVIAHRLTTIKEMDRILVMEGGKIIEEGSFDQLYKKQGRFFDLWEKQKL